jgi:hypothetical protein
MSCAVEPTTEEEEQPAESEAADSKPIEGPYYELTKDDITSHPDWTSMNIMLKGAKIGDKTTAVEKQLGALDKTEPVGPDHYRTAFEKSSYSVYTHKMTGELQKIELYSRFAGQIADPKFKKLLSSGDLNYMREAFGMEESSELNLNTTGMEYIYDAKGFRFAEYMLATGKMNSLLFSKIK